MEDKNIEYLSEKQRLMRICNDYMEAHKDIVLNPNPEAQQISVFYYNRIVKCKVIALYYWNNLIGRGICVCTQSDEYVTDNRFEEDDLSFFSNNEIKSIMDIFGINY